MNKLRKVKITLAVNYLIDEMWSYLIFLFHLQGTEHFVLTPNITFLFRGEYVHKMFMILEMIQVWLRKKIKSHGESKTDNWLWKTRNNFLENSTKTYHSNWNLNC